LKLIKIVIYNKLDPTKKLIIDNLLDNKQYDDFINQQEKSLINDPLGLYTVLKNIQNRKCSCGFLCIEIGTIYGDFDKLKPKNVTIPYNHQSNVHMIIKPIVIVNSTTPNPNPGPSPAPIPIPIDDDCDILSGNAPRFRERDQPIQRKFYRKVSVAEKIYSQDIFKQGLNVIIIQRDKKYSKCKIF
jgi:hypothetical protein